MKSQDLVQKNATLKLIRCSFKYIQFYLFTINHLISFQVMLNEYNPFHLVTEECQIKVAANVKMETGYIDSYNKHFVLKAYDGSSDILMQVDSTGGEEASFNLQSTATPFVRPTNNHVLLFVPEKQAFILINLLNSELQEFPLSAPSQWKDSEYELHYFNRTSLICLAETNRNEVNARLAFFNFLVAEETAIKENNVFQVEAGTWKVGDEFHISSSYGKLGWYSSFTKKLQIKIYENEKGVNTYSISTDSLSLDEEFKVLALWQRENFLFVVINPINKNSSSLPSDYSPIIRIDLTSNEYSPQFVLLQNYPLLLLRGCLNLNDYVILFSDKQTDGKATVYIFDKELQLIVNNESVPSSLKLISTFPSNSYALVDQNDGHFNIIHKQITRVNDLPFQKVLQLAQEAETLSKTISNAIIIFGADKTGKSTLRHYLAGQRLIHRFNEEFGFYEVVTQVDEMQGMEHEVRREQLPWMNHTEDAAIIDIPDWKRHGEYFIAQIRILLSRLFRAFKQLHFIITIPEQYITDSYQNEEFFSSLLDLIGRDDSVQNYISIVLTKVETAQDSLASFIERIEEITDINEETGSFIKGISQNERILVFENREINQSQGKAMLNKILSFEKLSLYEMETLAVEQDLNDASPAIDFIFYQSDYYIRLVNAYLLRTCHKLAPSTFLYIQHAINAYLSHNQQKIDPSKQLKTVDNVGLLLIAVLSKLRGFLDKLQKNQHIINQLKDLLLKLAQSLASELDEQSYFKDAVLAFASVMRNSLLLPLKRSTDNIDATFFSFVEKIFKEEPEGVLGQNLKKIINSLQNIPAVQSCPELQEFSSLFAKGLPKVKRIVYVEMTFEEQKREISKRGENMLSVICGLPSNALKLDLICDQLRKYCAKGKLQAKDYKPLCFYLRQASRICQYHGLYYEAIVLLYVIPDFAGIQQLVDDLAHHLKRTTPYEAKKMLSKQQGDLVDKLLTLARECLRDNLAKKLINLWTLSNETALKPAKLREQAQKKARQYLTSAKTIKQYRDRLESKEIIEFYNLTESDFKKLLLEKDVMIQKCIKFEEHEATRRNYEDTEALRYVLDDLPVPG